MYDKLWIFVWIRDILSTNFVYNIGLFTKSLNLLQQDNRQHYSLDI